MHARRPYEDLLGWDEGTQAALRGLSRGDLSILQAAVAHSRCELESQTEEREKPYFDVEGLHFLTGETTPINRAYARFMQMGWLRPVAVGEELLAMSPDTRKYALTPKGGRLLGQCLAHFLAHNPLPPAPGEAA